MERVYLPGTVRQRIQDQLKERKITQGELAAAIGMAESCNRACRQFSQPIPE